MNDCLTRIDATYVVTTSGLTLSRVSLFTFSEPYRIQVSRFLEYGWKVRQTQVDVSHLAPLERAGLIGPIWPLLPLPEIVDLLRRPPNSPETVYEPVAGDAP